MEFPICKVCLKNDILCSGCAKGIKKQNIKDDEIKLYRKLGKILKRYETVKDAKIDRIIDNRNSLFILTDKKSASKLIGKNGGMIRKIGKDINRQARVVTESSNVENFVKEIFFATPILGINVVYSEDKEKYKIRIPMSERVVLPISPETFSSIASVLNIDAELVFE